MAGQSKGAKGQKIGRNARAPSHKAYNAERRWEKNRKRRMERHQKTVQRKKSA